MRLKERYVHKYSIIGETPVNCVARLQEFDQ